MVMLISVLAWKMELWNPKNEEVSRVDRLKDRFISCFWLKDKRKALIICIASKFHRGKKLDKERENNTTLKILLASRRQF